MEREANRIFRLWEQESDPVEKEKLRGQLASLCEKHADAVVASVLGYVNKDVVQDTLLKAFTRMDQFKHKSLFTTWFHTIILNQCRDYLWSIRREKYFECVENLPTPSPLPESDPKYIEWLQKTLKKKQFQFYCDHMNLSPSALEEKYKLKPSGARARWFRILAKIKRKGIAICEKKQT